MNELIKDRICDQVFRLTDNYNDEELDYAIYIMNFWKEERKRQQEEIKTMTGCNNERLG